MKLNSWIRELKISAVVLYYTNGKSFSGSNDPYGWSLFPASMA